MSKTVILVPCYNEAARLRGDAFVRAVDADADLHFVFVNDGSRDGTARVLAELCAQRPERLAARDLAKNSGKAEAVRQGMLAAIEGGCDFAGYWDADLATPLDAIQRLRAQLFSNPAAYLVMGSRVKLMGRKVERSAVRHYFGRVFATGASLVLGLAVYDTQCGAKLFRNIPALPALFRSPFRVKWTFDVEILARLRLLERLGRVGPVEESIIEYPLEEWTDVPGSKVRMKDFVVGGIELLRTAWLLRGPGHAGRAERLFR